MAPDGPTQAPGESLAVCWLVEINFACSIDSPSVDRHDSRPQENFGDSWFENFVPGDNRTDRQPLRDRCRRLRSRGLHRAVDMTADQFRKNAKKAGMRPSEAELGGYRQTYAWVLKKPRIL